MLPVFAALSKPSNDEPLIDMMGTKGLDCGGPPQVVHVEVCLSKKVPLQAFPLKTKESPSHESAARVLSQTAEVSRLMIVREIATSR